MDSVEKVREFIHSGKYVEPRFAKMAIVQMKNKGVLSEKEMNDILYDWALWARPEQSWDMPEGKNTIMWKCGRGFGKSMMLSNLAIKLATENPDERIAIWAPDFGTLKRVVFFGESGILKNIHPDIKYEVNKADLFIKFDNGAEIQGYSAVAHESSRGAQSSVSLIEELGSWIYQREAYDAAQMINRLGIKPRTYIATTPTPTALIQEIVKSDNVHVINGTTMHNYFLTPDYAENLKNKLSDRMYRQEVLGEVLGDNPYALFKMSDIEKCRVESAPHLKRIIVAVDPAVTSNADSDETGIIVAGISADRHCYILEDATCTAATPEEWSAKAVAMYRKWGADRIVAEKNQGGQMVQSVIRSADRTLPPCKLVHASKGKEIRAEPVSAYYEHGEVHHVGRFVELERQMTEWNPVNGKSPDRLDALVWACTELMDKGMSKGAVNYG